MYGCRILSVKKIHSLDTGERFAWKCSCEITPWHHFITGKRYNKKYIIDRRLECVLDYDSLNRVYKDADVIIWDYCRFRKDERKEQFREKIVCDRALRASFNKKNK